MSDALATGSLRSFASVVDDAALQFELAWETADPAAPPDIDAFLPPESDARPRALLRLCQIDIERRTGAGLEPRAETYLERYPVLAADPDDAFAIVLTEAEARLRRGRQIDPDSYRSRFPPIVDRLIARLLHRSLPQVPGFEVEGELGRGAMGVVYKAKQVKLNRAVALKVVTAPDRQSITRFLLESQAVAAVRHPNVIQVFEAGEYADLPYLAMEFLDGGTLHAALKRQPVLAPNEAAELVAQLADGLQAVHDEGIVHRDLKPANVLFDGAGVPKVADFGLAMRGGVELTQTQGRFLGTPAYAAPEQAAGRREFVGPPADVWSLGVILYECLTGTRPFSGDEALSVLSKVQTESPRAPRAVNAGVPRDLELICLKCLEKRPADRYPSAAALADDLRRYVAGKPVTARPVGAVAQAAKWVRRNPLLAGTAATVMLASFVTAGAALWAFQKERQRAEAEREQMAEKDRRGRAEREAAVAAALQANDLQRLVSLVATAERDGLPVPPELKFTAANAVSSLGRSDEARQRLIALEAESDLTPELRARVELRLADELLGLDDAKAMNLLARARASKLLPPADLAYSDALVTDHMPDAIKKFQLALREDPAHFPSRRLLCIYLAVSGRLDEAIQVGEGTRLIAGNHPDVLLPLMLAHAFKGNERESFELFQRLRSHLDPELAEHFDEVVRFMPLMSEEFKAALDGKPTVITVELLKMKAVAARAAAVGQGEPIQLLGESTGYRYMRLPPQFRNPLSDFWDFSMIGAQGRDYGAEMGCDEIRLARLNANLARRPEGFMRFLHAFALTCRANAYASQYGREGPHGARFCELCRIAADAYALAAETPAMIEVKAIALEGAALHYALAAQGPKSPNAVPDAAARAKAREMVRRRLVFDQPLNPVARGYMILVSRRVEDYATARWLIDEWAKEKGDNDIGILSHRAEIEFAADAHLPALAAARKVLAKEPKNAAMLKIEADCLEKLRYDPDRVAPPPRAK